MTVTMVDYCTYHQVVHYEGHESPTVCKIVQRQASGDRDFDCCLPGSQAHGAVTSNLSNTTNSVPEGPAMSMTPIRSLPSREELNIGAKTSELLALVDAQEDGETLADCLEAALLALTDITGDDPNRPTVQRPGKVARRAISRITEMLESD